MQSRIFRLALMALAISLPALAQADDLDVTLSVIDGNDSTEEQLVNEIELPSEDDINQDAREEAAAGVDAANQAREQGSEFREQGLDRAREQERSDEAISR